MYHQPEKGLYEQLRPSRGFWGLVDASTLVSSLKNRLQEMGWDISYHNYGPDFATGEVSLDQLEFTELDPDAGDALLHEAFGLRDPERQ